MYRIEIIFMVGKLENFDLLFLVLRMMMMSGCEIGGLIVLGLIGFIGMVFMRIFRVFRIFCLFFFVLILILRFFRLRFSSL